MGEQHADHMTAPVHRGISFLKGVLIYPLQLTDSGAKTNHRPNYIRLSNQNPDEEKAVLYPDQWEDTVSLLER